MGLSLFGKGVGILVLQRKLDRHSLDVMHNPWRVKRQLRSASRGKRKENFCSRAFFKLLRWALILGYICFVTRGWYLSFSKFATGQTSTSSFQNESELFRHPSVTFCPQFKKTVDITAQILDQQSLGTCKNRCGQAHDWKMDCQCFDGCEGNCCQDYEALCSANETVTDNTDVSNLTLSDIDFASRLDEWSWRRQDFLTAFSHSFDGDPREGTFALDEDSLWTETIPHVHLSGKCFTYDPPFESHAGNWFGARIGLKLPDYGYLPETDKNRLLRERMMIFVHERGQFHFYKQADYPGSKLLDMSWVEYNRATKISLEYKFHTALNKAERPCTHDPDYNFYKCVELKYSERRGCQPPWHHFNDSSIPVCSRVSEIREKFRLGSGPLADNDYHRPEWSPRGISNYTKCPLPCVTTQIIPTYSYDIIPEWHYLKPMENGADWVLHLYFKNYLFTYETEYKVCDGTCLIGEIGGNLGFFLGGSILAFSDVLLDYLQTKTNL